MRKDLIKAENFDEHILSTVGSVEGAYMRQICLFACPCYSRVGELFVSAWLCLNFICELLTMKVGIVICLLSQSQG